MEANYSLRRHRVCSKQTIGPQLGGRSLPVAANCSLVRQHPCNSLLIALHRRARKEGIRQGGQGLLEGLGQQGRHGHPGGQGQLLGVRGQLGGWLSVAMRGRLPFPCCCWSTMPSPLPWAAVTYS